MHMKHLFKLAVTVVLVSVSNLTGQELKPIQLPSPQTQIGKPLMQVLMLRQSSRTFDSKALPLQEIANLLWAADGINRPETGKRTAPSAMNWQEVDVYVMMKDGAYRYDAITNCLKLVVAQDLREATGKQPFVKEAPLNLVYVSDYARMEKASNDDRILFGAADVGFIAQNVYLYCASQGLAVVVRGMIDRDVLAPALKLRSDQKIILAQTVGYPK
jgi:SagB-type dehydrogenase family enzyme